MAPAKPNKQSILLIKLMPISKTNHIYSLFQWPTPKNQGRGEGFSWIKISACTISFEGVNPVQCNHLKFIAAIIVHNSLKHKRNVYIVEAQAWLSKTHVLLNKHINNLDTQSICQICLLLILGDPGTVSRVGKKDGTKVFKYRWKSPWVPTLTELFPKLQADAGSRLGTKNALYYCAQSANSFSWVFFASSYTTARPFTKLVRARETFIFYFPNQKRRNYGWVEKTFAICRSNSICPENTLFLTHHNVSQIKAS